MLQQTLSARRSVQCFALGVAILAAVACSGNKAKDASSPGSSPGAAGIAYASQISCVDTNKTMTSPVVLKKVEGCLYRASSSRLEANFGYGGELSRDHLQLTINAFKAAGSFTSSAADNETDTSVKLNGYNEQPETDGSHSTLGGTSAGSPDCRGSCTISITEAGVVGAAIGEKGRVSGTITCGSLAAAGVGCMKCTVGAAIAFDIQDCEHVE